MKKLITVFGILFCSVTYGQTKDSGIVSMPFPEQSIFKSEDWTIRVPAKMPTAFVIRLGGMKLAIPESEFQKLIDVIVTALIKSDINFTLTPLK